MGSFGVVMDPPPFDDDLGPTQRVEDFTGQQIVHCPGVHVYMHQRGAFVW